MFRSNLIKILQQQIDKYGDAQVYIAKSVKDGFVGVDIKSLGLDADDNTVIDIENYEVHDVHI